MLAGDVTEMPTLVQEGCAAEMEAPRADAPTLGLPQGFVCVLSSDRDWEKSHHVLELEEKYSKNMPPFLSGVL